MVISWGWLELGWVDLRSYDYGRVSCFLVYSRKWVASSFDLIHCVWNRFLWVLCFLCSLLDECDHSDWGGDHFSSRYRLEHDMTDQLTTSCCVLVDLFVSWCVLPSGGKQRSDCDAILDAIRSGLWRRLIYRHHSPTNLEPEGGRNLIPRMVHRTMTSWTCVLGCLSNATLSLD